MRITHVLRGEDLLSSTPRQIVLYRALAELGLAGGVPQFGHLPYVMGEGNKKLSKRDPQSSLFHHRDRGFLPEGLVNYLALLGWSIAPDRDVFSADELAAAFEIRDVNASPARFDLKKAEAINAAHIRLLPAADLARRITPYLHGFGLVEAGSFEELPPREQELLTAAAPLVQERMTLLDEAPGRLGFFFAADDAVEFDPAAVARLGPHARAVLEATLAGLGSVGEWTARGIQDALRAALVDGLGLKPKDAFAPVRVAVTGSRVSPPLFESMELLGRGASVRRVERLAALPDID
jgi:glutamyl-tRNA synthetase